MSIGLRVKGGVMYTASTGKFAAILHVWNNLEATGEPDDEYVHPEQFDSEEDAFRFYKRQVEPLIVKLIRMSGIDMQRKAINEVWLRAEP